MNVTMSRCLSIADHIRYQLLDLQSLLIADFAPEHICAFLLAQNFLKNRKWLLYPYTAERKDVLGNTSPEARDISQGRGFCTRGPRDCPRAKPEGNLVLVMSFMGL